MMQSNLAEFFSCIPHFWWWWWRRKMALMRAWRSGTQWLHYSRQKGQDHFPQMERENLGTAWHTQGSFHRVHKRPLRYERKKLHTSYNLIDKRKQKSNQDNLCLTASLSILHKNSKSQLESRLINQKLKLKSLIQHWEYSELSGQKFIESAKNGQFGKFLKTWSLWSNIVTI